MTLYSVLPLSNGGVRGKVAKKDIRVPSLKAYGRIVETPFGLLGTDENALTFALGYTMQQCPRLLQMFIRDIGLRGFRLNSLLKAEIRLQKHRKEGITDIEIRLPSRVHLIIEAKVGLNIPTLGKCKEYIEALKSSKEKERKLVILLEADAIPTLDLYRRQDKDCKEFLLAFQWIKLLEMRNNLLNEFPENRNEGKWIRAFFDFLEKEFEMKSYTTEVWIVPASMKPLWEGGWSFYDTHIKGKILYRTRKDRYSNQKPLYIALRTAGKVRTIQRVLKVEHEVTPIDKLPQLGNIKDSWPSERCTIWHLSDPTPLPQPIPTGDPLMRARHVFCDMDILLSSSSVRDVEQCMKQRYATSP